MKVDDSGMPEEAYWNSLFDIGSIINWLAIQKFSSIVEIGCGYGTFTVPVASESQGHIHAFDIEPAMLEVSQNNLRKQGLLNVTFHLRDVLERGTGLEPNSVEMVLLFNILHFEEKRVLLAEAARVLKNGGVVAIIHWRKDIPTPRGPVIETRPDLHQILAASEGLSLRLHGDIRMLKPYHFGVQLVKAA